ncbi:hypothetical protein FOA52_003883 [Chlamydomonas sp. UWO 241]|nr:hypothetical protein FOA52_003883 [Chlamydomonas sp. UWO 241]
MAPGELVWRPGPGPGSHDTAVHPLHSLRGAETTPRLHPHLPLPLTSGPRGMTPGELGWRVAALLSQMAAQQGEPGGAVGAARLAAARNAERAEAEQQRLRNLQQKERREQRQQFQLVAAALWLDRAPTPAPAAALDLPRAPPPPLHLTPTAAEHPLAPAPSPAPAAALLLPLLRACLPGMQPYHVRRAVWALARMRQHGGGGGGGSCSGGGAAWLSGGSGAISGVGRSGGNSGGGGGAAWASGAEFARVFSAAGDRLLSVGDLPISDAALVAWSFASAGVRHDALFALFARLAGSPHGVRAMSTQDLINIAWAFAADQKARVSAAATVRAASATRAARLGVGAIPPVTQTPPARLAPLVSCLVDAAHDRLHEFTPTQAATLGWALGVLNFGHAEFMAELAGAAVAQSSARPLTPPQAATLMRAAAANGCTSPAALGPLAARLATREAAGELVGI